MDFALRCSICYVLHDQTVIQHTRTKMRMRSVGGEAGCEVCKLFAIGLQRCIIFLEQVCILFILVCIQFAVGLLCVYIILYTF